MAAINFGYYADVPQDVHRLMDVVEGFDENQQSIHDFMKKLLEEKNFFSTHTAWMSQSQRLAEWCLLWYAGMYKSKRIILEEKIQAWNNEMCRMDSPETDWSRWNMVLKNWDRPDVRFVVTMMEDEALVRCAKNSPISEIYWAEWNRFNDVQNDAITSKKISKQRLDWFLQAEQHPV